MKIPTKYLPNYYYLGVRVHVSLKMVSLWRVLSLICKVYNVLPVKLVTLELMVAIALL